jgi:hypothetical protein
MKIVCLGWGSLIWDSGNLLTQGEWFADGPLVPVEFLRKSSNGRITLVLNNTAKPVQSLWIEMGTTDLEVAKKSLGKREYENASDDWIRKNIGVWMKGENSPELIPSLETWTQTKNIDAVIWTALPCKHPTSDELVPAEKAEVIDYLKNLTDEKLENAKRYIINAPTQIDTNYRDSIVRALGWS